jgi:hypothetical protein
VAQRPAQDVGVTFGGLAQQQQRFAVVVAWVVGQHVLHVLVTIVTSRRESEICELVKCAADSSLECWHHAP